MNFLAFGTERERRTATSGSRSRGGYSPILLSTGDVRLCGDFNLSRTRGALRTLLRSKACAIIAEFAVTRPARALYPRAEKVRR